ncbi:MAG: hypothetical protein E6I94_02110, partial [Chloroflexi bacterium]
MRLAPGPDGTLFAAIPRSGGWVLALLDRGGRPRPGWPILVENAGPCELLLPLEDGGIRLVCLTSRPGADTSDEWAYAFDAGGRSLTGWPVPLPPGQWTAGRMALDELVLFGVELSPPAQWLTTVAADGAIRSGKKVPGDDAWGHSGGDVGPDRVAVGVEDGGLIEGSAEVSRITALALSGARAGWPVTIDGVASGPVFASAGRVVLTVGSRVQGTSRIVVVDPRTRALSRSPRLAIRTAESGVDCVASLPERPLVARDGKIVVFSAVDTAIFAL